MWCPGVLGDEPMRGWQDRLLSSVEEKDDVIPKFVLLALGKQHPNRLQHEGTTEYVCENICYNKLW